MNQTETSSGTTLWSEMVEKQINESNTPYDTCRESGDEQPLIHVKAAAPKCVQKKMDKSQASSSSSVTPHSRSLKNRRTNIQTHVTEGHALIKDNLDKFEKRMQEKTNRDPAMTSHPRPQQQKTERKKGDPRLQNSATGKNKPSPPEFSQNQMNQLINQVQELTNRLQENNILLTQEKDKRLAAEYEWKLKLEQLQEVESHLKEEYHHRIVIEKELKWCKRKVDELRLGPKAPKSGRKNRSTPAEVHYELKNGKKQLQEQTSTNIELAFKVKTQQEVIDNLELKVADLIMQLKSASETIKHQPEKTGDMLKSSAAEESTKMEAVSTQTEDFVSEPVCETRVICTKTETFVSEDVSTICTQTEDLDTEEVSDVKDVSNNQLEVIEEIPKSEEPEELPTNNLFSPKPEETLTSDPKPSLWRRIKKALTPAHRRQYKSRRQNQGLQVTTDIPAGSKISSTAALKVPEPERPEPESLQHGGASKNPSLQSISSKRYSKKT